MEVTGEEEEGTRVRWWMGSEGLVGEGLSLELRGSKAAAASTSKSDIPLGPNGSSEYFGGIGLPNPPLFCNPDVDIGKVMELEELLRSVNVMSGGLAVLTLLLVLFDSSNDGFNGKIASTCRWLECRYCCKFSDALRL